MKHIVEFFSNHINIRILEARHIEMKNRILRPILFQRINGKPFERMRNVEC